MKPVYPKRYKETSSTPRARLAHRCAMIIVPKIRGFICIAAHPDGCAAHVRQQVDYVKSKGAIAGAPKRVLVIGASTGYGLASRIVAGC